MATASLEQIIVQNLVELCDKTHCTRRLLDSCLARQILTLDQCEQIAIEKLEYEQNRKFYLILRKVDHTNILKCIQIMEEDNTRQVTQVLDILKTSIQGQESSRTAELDPGASPVKSPVVPRQANNIKPTANSLQTNPVMPKKAPTKLKNDLEESNQDFSKANIHNDGTPTTITPEISGFHFAIKAGDVNRVNGLLRQGVDVNCADKGGCTALYFAAENGDQNLVELLLRNRANPNISSANNVTPLHLATKGSFESIAKILLENGANVNADTSRYPETPLMWTIHTSNCGMMNLLLDHGADINRKDKDGRTPLDLALALGREYLDRELIVKYLIRKGAVKG